MSFRFLRQRWSSICRNRLIFHSQSFPDEHSLLTNEIREMNLAIVWNIEHGLWQITHNTQCIKVFKILKEKKNQNHEKKNEIYFLKKLFHFFLLLGLTKFLIPENHFLNSSLLKVIPTAKLQRANPRKTQPWTPSNLSNRRITAIPNGPNPNPHQIALLSISPQNRNPARQITANPYIQRLPFFLLFLLLHPSKPSHPKPFQNPRPPLPPPPSPPPISSRTKSNGGGKSLRLDAASETNLVIIRIVSWDRALRLPLLANSVGFLCWVWNRIRLERWKTALLGFGIWSPALDSGRDRWV